MTEVFWFLRISHAAEALPHAKFHAFRITGGELVAESCCGTVGIEQCDDEPARDEIEPASRRCGRCEQAVARG